MTNHYKYVYGTTGPQADKLNQIVDVGLKIAEEYIEISKPTTVRIWIRKRGEDQSPKEMLSSGDGSRKRSIYITLSKKFLNSRQLRQLSSTVIHEYVHVLRHNLRDSKTVLAAAIEEGISCYIQTMLWKAPNYLDIKTLNERMVRICWKKLSAALSKSQHKYPIIWKDQAYREMLYRLGFGIVRKYVHANKKISYRKLVLTSQAKLVKFAQECYGK
jgi:uncharacterized protein YjaZ